MSKVRSVKAIQVDANGRGALGLQDPTGELQTGTCDSSGNLNVNLAAGGAAATIADGADVTQGAIADAAVASDANGTISGKLRGLVKILADAWDSANHRLTVGLGAGTNLVGLVRSNALRDGGTVYRTGVTAADKCVIPTVGAPGAVVDNSADGAAALTAGNTYFYTVAASNVQGWTQPATAQSKTTAADANNHHSLDIPITQVAGATGYEIFLSTGANPAWVGHITEAQRAAGGARITAMGVTDTAGSNAAGTVRVQVVGTGTASNASFWTTNNFAYITAGVPAISMAGYASLVVHWQIVPTDLRAAFAALTFSVFEVDQVTGADHWVLNSNLYAANSQINLQGIFGSAARPGSPGVKLLIDTHPGVPINMWYERF